MIPPLPPNWREALVTLEAEARPHVLVTLVETLGSTPRGAGTKMVVTAEAVSGSIGGGVLENEAFSTARRLLAEGASGPTLEKVMLGADRDQCCGGAVTLLFEVFVPEGITLALFGAGHVGKALVRVLEGTGVRVLWFDERPAPFPPGTWAATRETPDPAAVVPDLPPGARVLVMTHSHQRDYEILAALLERRDLGPLGVIGSKTKWARFRSRLLDAGHPAERIDAIACPIGLPGVGGKRPAEIAISIAVDILRTGDPSP
ncbi:MAG: xanthine dehydrogenase accessory protein XdhC [Rhodospirillum sp.]|nr:xanthine dehydrogenase accessory protein XdhC [Rhodospirillum sp.]MCF8488301.1 xanthine dehydrogenase accessory protein XdhC [Rhodospirillum sp.]